MARPKRILLTAEQLRAIDWRNERRSFAEIGRDLKLSAEAIRKWFRPSAFVRQCADTFNSSKGRQLYPDSSELMRRYSAAEILIPAGKEFALHSDEWTARKNQVELVYGDIPALADLWVLQDIAVINLIAIEALTGEYDVTRPWRYKHYFVDGEDIESADSHII